MSKLVLDEYFASSEFLTSAEAGNLIDSSILNSSSSASISGNPLSTSSMIPSSHKLTSASPFVDSGIGLNVMTSQFSQGNASVEVDDEVFTMDSDGKWGLLDSSRRPYTDWPEWCLFRGAKFKFNSQLDHVQSTKWLDTITSQPFLSRRE